MALGCVGRSKLFLKLFQVKGFDCCRLSSIPTQYRLYTSDTTLQERPQAIEHSNNDPEALSENDRVSSEFYNRNPRNLESMGIAMKDRGWGMSSFHRIYWHKLEFEEKGRYTTAYVEHRNGFRVLSATTKEWAIRKFLYGTSNVSAAHNIGRVLAQRCIQSGIYNVCWETKKPRVMKDTVEAFVKGMTDGGVVLKEPLPYTYDTKPDDYFPEYLGKDYAEELQNVRKELDATCELEFKDYDFDKSDENADR